MQKGYHYKTCGLRNIWLRNGYEMRDSAYGKSVAIKDLDGLHRAIGLYLVRNKPRLSGSEIRFLRKELDLSQSQLANILGVSEPTVRGWEKSRTKITPPAERLMRALYQEYAEGPSALGELIERIGQLNRELHFKKIELHETREGWCAEAFSIMGLVDTKDIGTPYKTFTPARNPLKITPKLSGFYTKSEQGCRRPKPFPEPSSTSCSKIRAGT